CPPALSRSSNGSIRQAIRFPSRKTCAWLPSASRTSLSVSLLMKILGLEFSSDLRSVAVGEISTSAARCIGTRAEPGPRGSTGLTLVDRLLRESGIARQEIEVIALGLGPGSHAGIRSAI